VSKRIVVVPKKMPYLKVLLSTRRGLRDEIKKALTEAVPMMDSSVDDSKTCLMTILEKLKTFRTQLEDLDEEVIIVIIEDDSLVDDEVASSSFFMDLFLEAMASIQIAVTSEKSKTGSYEGSVKMSVLATFVSHAVMSMDSMLQQCYACAPDSDACSGSAKTSDVQMVDHFEPSGNRDPMKENGAHAANGPISSTRSNQRWPRGSPVKGQAPSPQATYEEHENRYGRLKSSFSEEEEAGGTRMKKFDEKPFTADRKGYGEYAIEPD
jgi:hypothetical protein